jgi:folylpolyglutamate synthase/dihydropteroate synthase
LKSTSEPGPPKFEVLTSTATKTFRRLKLNITVMDVEIGGRPDVTNAIPDNIVVVSALTGTDLNHQRFLGSAAAEVAMEVGIGRGGEAVRVGEAEVEKACAGISEVIWSELPSPLNTLNGKSILVDSAHNRGSAQGLLSFQQRQDFFSYALDG